MSYEPHIIIHYQGLQEAASELQDKILRARATHIKAAWEEIWKLIDEEPIEFGEERFLIIHPEFTAHNKLVREKLDELEIYHVTKLM